jgi:hypothetical protein
MVLAEGYMHLIIPIDMTISTQKGLIFLLLLFFVFPFITAAQEGMPVAVRPCGTDRLLAQLRKDPAFVAREKAINQALLKKHYLNVSAAPPAVVTLPVVVHIIIEDPNAYTDAAVIQAILMSNDKGMAEQVVSTDEQLDYLFKNPGTYKVRLYATNGSCEDTSNPVTIVVDDPTADGVIHIESVTCYNEDKVQVKLWVENRGYVTIPKNTPVSFYDDDPRTGRGNLLGTPWLLQTDLPGKCASYEYTATITVGRAYLDTLVSVMNDNGTTLPLTLPNTRITRSNFQ